MSYGLRKRLKRHEKEVHSSEKSFQCETCGKIFSNRNQFKRHQKKSQISKKSEQLKENVDSKDNNVEPLKCMPVIIPFAKRPKVAE